MLDIFFRPRRPMKRFRSIEDRDFLPTEMLPVWCVIGGNFVRKQLIVKLSQLLRGCREFPVQGARFSPIERQGRRSSSGIADAPRHRNPIVESLVNRVFARVLSPAPNDRADSHERPSLMAYNQLCLP